MAPAARKGLSANLSRGQQQPGIISWLRHRQRLLGYDGTQNNDGLEWLSGRELQRGAIDSRDETLSYPFDTTIHILANGKAMLP